MGISTFTVECTPVCDQSNYPGNLYLDYHLHNICLLHFSFETLIISFLVSLVLVTREERKEGKREWLHFKCV